MQPYSSKNYLIAGPQCVMDALVVGLLATRNAKFVEEWKTGFQELHIYYRHKIVLALFELSNLSFRGYKEMQSKVIQWMVDRYLCSVSIYSENGVEMVSSSSSSTDMKSCIFLQKEPISSADRLSYKPTDMVPHWDFDSEFVTDPFDTYKVMMPNAVSTPFPKPLIYKPVIDSIFSKQKEKEKDPVFSVLFQTRHCERKYWTEADLMKKMNEKKLITLGPVLVSASGLPPITDSVYSIHSVDSVIQDGSNRVFSVLVWVLNYHHRHLFRSQIQSTFGNAQYVDRFYQSPSDPNQSKSFDAHKKAAVNQGNGPKAIPKAIPKDIPKAIPKDILPKAIPKDILPKAIPKDIPKAIPKDILKDIAKDIAKDIPKLTITIPSEKTTQAAHVLCLMKK
jgi:hypothetical protein